MKKYIINSLSYLFLLGALVACTEDLNPVVEDPDDVVADAIYQSKSDYLSGLAKVYAGLAVTGQIGPAGDADIVGIDEGASQYIRQFWTLQEIPTDEAVIGWLDGNLPKMNTFEWSSNNEFITAMYYRVYFTIAVANEFIRESTPEKVSARGISGADAEEVARYRKEARFLRALAYWHGMDLFGDIPLITENDPTGLYYPERAPRTEIFSFIESELLEIESGMLSPRAVHGRADQAAAWTLLAKLYLNAETYVGEAHYTDALTYINRVINANYSLDDDYDHLFMTDNNQSPEIIFPIVYDGLETQTYGGTTFLVHAAVGGSMPAAEYGIDGGWGGIRTTKNLVLKFPYNTAGDYTSSPDDRANFYTDGMQLEIDVLLDNFTDGLAMEKFVNVSSTGDPGARLDFVDTDFPMFRLADVYLMYAEALLRGGAGGDMGTATSYINSIRERAYGNTDGNVSQSDITLDFIIDERARELYWEGHRRTDLIRFGKFADSDYVWPWKGGSQQGSSLSAHLNLYPIPSAELNANPNSSQNEGY